MNIIIEKARDIHALALFITEMNNEKHSHIGFCGREYEWNLKALQEDFLGGDGSLHFYIAKNNSEKIVAALGADLDETTAEVWGPFNQTDSLGIQEQLWERFVKEYPIVQSFYFFINQENVMQKNFMEKLHAKERGKHLHLEIKRQNFTQVQKLKSVSFDVKDEASFTTLHTEAFPNTYYDAKTIINRIDNGNVLKVLKDENDILQGYAYFELDKDLHEASLEYISISSHYRGQGLGSLLLREVLTEVFSYHGFSEIQLTVEDTNTTANNLYFKTGFEKNDTLISYLFEKEEDN